MFVGEQREDVRARVETEEFGCALLLAQRDTFISVVFAPLSTIICLLESMVAISCFESRTRTRFLFERVFLLVVNVLLFLQERIAPGSLENLINSLKWAGLSPDEGPTFGGQYGPYVQSERLPIYREMSERLLESGAAYRCFCTPKRLELLRREAAKNRETIRYDNRCRTLTNDEIQENITSEKPYTIRLKLKPGPMVVDDIVFGKVSYDLSLIEGDPILYKSDGFPTYHLANVVDDHLMNISHVLRGTEWLVSTPKHLMLYEAFGWQPPLYAHLPLIVNKDGTKLSKRHDDIRIDTFRAKGYYPETTTNYLTQMGGGFPQLNTTDCDRLYSLPQLVDAFRLNKVHQNNCKIDAAKVQLLNRLTLKQVLQDDPRRLIEDLKRLIPPAMTLDESYLTKIINWSVDRIFTLNDLSSPEFSFLWSRLEYSWRLEDIGGRMDCEKVIIVLAKTLETLSASQHFDDEPSLLAQLKSVHQEQLAEMIKFGSFMKLLRYSLTNLKVGPPVAETMCLLGKPTTMAYLEAVIDYVRRTLANVKVAENVMRNAK